MSDDTTPPIEVHASPLPDQAWSALRASVLALTAFALGRHWIEGDVATLVTALLGIVAPLILGQLKTRERATQLTNIAADPRTPDDVATVKQP